MKIDKDQEIQELLDQDFLRAETNLDDQAVVDTYRSIYEELNSDEGISIPNQFASEVSQRVFLDFEKRMDFKFSLYSIGIVTLVVGLALVAFSIFNMNVDFDLYNSIISNYQLLIGIAALLGLVAVADKVLLQKLAT